eukprot:232242_1
MGNKCICGHIDETSKISQNNSTIKQHNQIEQYMHQEIKNSITNSKLQVLISGYYRTNYCYYISNDLVQISIMFLLIHEHFVFDPLWHCIHEIKGINNNIIQCNFSQLDTCTVFGRNITYVSNNNTCNYFHWRFRIIHFSNSKWSFIIGLTNGDQHQWHNVIKNRALRINRGAIQLIQQNVTDENKQKSSAALSVKYTENNFRVIDMYLDLNKFKLTFTLHNDTNSILHSVDVDSIINYRMVVSITCKTAAGIELLSYQHSKFYPNETINLEYIKSVCNIDAKLKYLETLRSSSENLIGFHDDYIECLMLQKQYLSSHAYIRKNNINMLYNAHIVIQLANYFQRQNDYVHMHIALEIYLLLSDDILIKENLCSRVAFCYMEISDELQQMTIAKTYYQLHLKHAINITDSDKSKYLKCLLNIGNEYYRLGDYQTALQHYLKCKNCWLTTNVKHKIAVCYEHTKQYQDAIRWYKKCFSEIPKNSKYACKIAEMYSLIHNQYEANKYFITATKIDDKVNMYYVNFTYAQFLYRGKHYETSMQYFRHALNATDNNNSISVCCKAIALCYCEQNDCNGLLSREFNATKVKGWLDISILYAIMKDYKNAIKYYEQARVIDPNNARKYEKEYLHDNEFAEYVLSLAKDFRTEYDIITAREYFNFANIISIGDGKFKIHCNYAEFLRSFDCSIQETLIYYKQSLKYAITHFQQAHVCIEIAMLYNQNGDLSQFETYLLKALESDATNIAALNHLGFFYYGMKRYELAYEYFIKCINIEPEDSLLNANMGNCLYEMKRHEEALIYLKKSISNEVDLKYCSVNVRAKCLRNSANILHIKGEYYESINMCKQLLQLIRKNDMMGSKDEIYCLISKNYYDIGNFQKALKYQTEALKIDEDNPNYKQRLQQIEDCMIVKRM